MDAHEILAHILSTSPQTLIVFMYALIGGLVPALFWLWFWMHEKNHHKEPHRVIVTIFLLGMIAVFVSYILQKSVTGYIEGRAIVAGIFDFRNQIQNSQSVTLIYVIIEEMTKFGAAYLIAFKTKVLKTPIDAFIYLMTAALGFAAMENTLYLIQPLLAGQTLETIITGHMRFIGSSILHVTSSGILSVCIGLSFCKSFWKREGFIWLGLTLACLIHWCFNVFLAIDGDTSAFLVFSSVWIVTIGLILMLERVKVKKCF